MTELTPHAPNPEPAARSFRRKSLLDTLEKPSVAVPMLLASAVIGLVLAFVAVRAFNAGWSTTGDRGTAPIADNPPVTATAEAATARSPDVRVAEINVLQPQPQSPAEARAVVTLAPPPAIEIAAAPAQPSGTTAARASTASAAAAAPTPATPNPVTASAANAPVRAPAPTRSRDGLDKEPGPLFQSVDTEGERGVRDVLHVAGGADRPAQNADVIVAAQRMPRSAGDVRVGISVDARSARRLNEEASRAFWDRQDVREALRIQRAAFEANPQDPEIAGNLAFYYLKQQPAQPERARAAALHALSTPSPRFPGGRIEDWTSLGVAEALLGHSTDAAHAFLVTAALSGNLERTCRAGLNAVTSYGDEVRGPVATMLQRVHQQGRSGESPYCAWPPNWGAGRRYP